MPDLDANASAVAIQHIKLENEGWERDTSVQELVEPSLYFGEADALSGKRSEVKDSHDG